VKALDLEEFRGVLFLTVSRRVWLFFRVTEVWWAKDVKDVSFDGKRKCRDWNREHDGKADCSLSFSRRLDCLADAWMLRTEQVESLSVNVHRLPRRAGGGT